MVVRLYFPTPRSSVSAGGTTTFSQVVVQPATSVFRFHACSAVLLWRIWPTLSQMSEQNGATRSLFRWTPHVFGLVIPGSPIPVFSELHDSRPCTCLVLGKCANDSSLFSSSFLPLGIHTLALCPTLPPLGGSTVSGSLLAGEHSPVSCPLFELFPNGGFSSPL